MRVVLDTAFCGERFAAARAQGGRLHYIAVAPAVPAADTITDAGLRAAWPLNVPGFHRVILNEDVTLDLLAGALDAVLPQVIARVDAFHLHAGVTAPMARTLARLAAPGAVLHVRAPGEALVWALTAAGFACRIATREADAGTDVDGQTAPDIVAEYRGRKSLPAMKPQRKQPALRRAVVIGAGVAGASAAHRLCARGWQVTLIERHAQPAQEASGNVAGIFMPLLSRDDNIPTRLSRAAYLFALREWRRMGGAGKAFDGAGCGVLQLARDDKHARVQQEVLAQWTYPAEYARWADAAESSALIGAATPHGGWLFAQGGWARPASLCDAMLAVCGERLQRVFCTEALSLQRVDGEWQVRGEDGALISQAPTAILANGASAIKIEQAAQLPLSKLRGQVTHLPVDGAAAPPVLPLVVCREAYVTPPSNGIVCAGATYDNDDDPALRASSQLENLARLAEIIPGDAVSALAQTAPLAGRVGFRCAAPDRLPLAGALPDYASAGRLEFLPDVPRHEGLYCLLGYASRGLIWAPLMAELLVCQLEDTPPPLEAALVDALDAGRFLLKQRRREQ
ncbi:FAD-dependent 5-carboxymethylaminomethyl-2-thiouridine(34) oxidoreductase MnmC [Duganella sp. sic0402]|uniref:FAD-dependent 5-carboxymethylaminomethyl-2-thiouridine(34) oxidoreductase MnmC n=1 Tax=Duganella sp. sic0402 TaxID=2854786 RepID=UPI001C46D547|nr:FAD-dependent 5-carboxymethylaminomethyl-2-thiouridine(34) oxidoreductase MnmC [Duganella sp. sic0402]MBV7538399.1 FAD-dependent 5-carboxymethylaminomethyl-2-thiouridine(34) oxidoreductase MnmC [Duganella sp. sic0402]